VDAEYTRQLHDGISGINIAFACKLLNAVLQDCCCLALQNKLSEMLSVAVAGRTWTSCAMWL
jgi:hypothetical protein